jgi:predicted DNA-binding transcriptional regulator AlpA
VTIQEKLRQAQQRVEKQRAQALATRPTGKPGPAASRRKPPTPKTERPSALATAPPLEKVLLSRADLNALGISYSRAHLARLVAEGKFPAPVALGGPEPSARKAWRVADVEAWLAALPYTNAGDREAAE